MPEKSYSSIPSVNEVLESEKLIDSIRRFPRDLVVNAVRMELGLVRERIRNGLFQEWMIEIESLGNQIEKRLTQETRPLFQSVINATGIVLHTNLGRAPLAKEAAEAVFATASGYLNLELDLDTGKRSSRQNIIRKWLCQLTGAESATVVNNNAAATIIVLRATGLGKEVILSRGQLVEIGGGFRIPEIMTVSGAILREIGTTNITRISDFEKAISANTGALLQIHTSNYRIRGHTKSVLLEELVQLGQKHLIPVIDDVGSGAFVEMKRFGFDNEPSPRESIAKGADLVIFSGDKLLGGPQAGIILGKKVWIERIEKDPLMRAFRLDKMSLCALESTLQLYLDDNQALRHIPVLYMLGISLNALHDRCKEVVGQLEGFEGIDRLNIIPGESFVGGGSLPDQPLVTWLVEIGFQSKIAGVIARNLRNCKPAVMTRVQNNRILLDLRTVLPDQLGPLIDCLKMALSVSSNHSLDKASNRNEIPNTELMDDEIIQP